MFPQHPDKTVYQHRHWCSCSEHYAGGDILLNALVDGWLPERWVPYDEHWLGQRRRVVVYHFELTRAGEHLTMCVQGNPFVERIICELELQVMRTQEYEPALVDI